VVGGEGAIEGKERSAHVEGFGGEAVDEMGGGCKGIRPEGGGMEAWKSRVRVTLFRVRRMQSALLFC
jgi:hypothetical protein